MVIVLTPGEKIEIEFADTDRSVVVAFEYVQNLNRPNSDSC